MTDRQWDRVALFISLLAVVLAALSSFQVFEGLPHLEDEFANLWQAKIMAQGDISQPTPAEPKSFLVPFVVDYQGQRFGKYPPGWPALLSLGVRAGVPGWVNPLLAGWAVWLTYRLASRWLDGGLASLAAALIAFSPMLLMLSGSLMSHNLSLLLALSFSLSWLDLFKPREEKQLAAWFLGLVAGGSLGLLILTRPLTAFGVALPFGFHGLWLLFGNDESWHWTLVIGGLTLALASLLLLWQYALSGDPLRNLYTLWWEYDRIGFGPDIGSLSSGHNLHQAWINTRFSLRTGLHDTFGWPYLSWLFLPMGLLVLLPRASARPLLAVLPSLIIVYSFYWIGSWLLGPRYYYEGLPSMAIMSSAGIGWLAGWLGRVQVPGWRPLATTALVTLLLLTNILFYLPTRLGGMHGLYGIERDRLQAIGSKGLNQALIIVHSEHWSVYGNLLPLRSPFSNRSIQVAWSRGAIPDQRVANLFPDWDLYHYFADEPGVLFRQIR